MIREHLEPAWLERFDSLSAAEREPGLRHATRCAECRCLLAAGDPSRLFSLLATEPVPREALERLSSRVHDELDGRQRTGLRGRRRWAWASVAASLILGGTIGAYLVTRPTATPVPERALLAPTSAAEVVPRAEEAPVGGIRVLSSPGDAQVLDLSVGETQVVMIFDKELEI